MRLFCFFGGFKCYKGAELTWMSLNYTLFLHLVKSKMKHGGVWGRVMTIVCCVSACVCLFSVGNNFFLRGCSTLGEVCFKVVHQGKEFNKSCRKRSGSGISERRPRKEVENITTWAGWQSRTGRLCLQSVKTLCRVWILTYNVENLWQGLSRHEFILEGPEHALRGLIDWHVIVTDIFCQWEGPAPFCVAGRYFLYVMKMATRLIMTAWISSKSLLWVKIEVSTVNCY